MKTNEERKAIVRQKSTRFGDWVIAPKWRSRMNKKTLGCETGSGKQGGSVFWFMWGVFYDPQDITTAHPFKEFSKFKDAKVYVKARTQPKATTEYGYHG